MSWEMMIYISKESELVLNNGLSSIYFYANWLKFHKKMTIMFGKVEESFTKINYYAVDVDDFKGTCRRFNVDSIPTVIIFNKGKEVERICGITLTSAFKKAFADIYNTKGENHAI